jgi:alkaline phosphatase
MRKSSYNLAFILVLTSLFTASCVVKPPTTLHIEVTRKAIQTEIVEMRVLITPTSFPEKKAKYIFLFIGDGMGVAQRTAAELYLAATVGTGGRPEETTLLMNTFPAQGMDTTYDLKSVIPDSAATGTALATGHKTYSGVISMNIDGTESYETIAEVAKKSGMKVGIISTVSIDHATPAVFYAHQPSRSNYYEIDQALVNSDFDYFAGGPLKRPTGNDKENPAPDLYGIAGQNGFTVAMGREAFEALEPGVGKVLIMPDYMIDGNALYYTIDDVPANDLTIVDFTEKAIELLDNPDGFFIMVEAGKIDWACHANDAAAAIHDILAFDEAIGVAFDFYLEHPDETLIVVTGDHETGGMTIGFAGTQYSTFFEKIKFQHISYDQFNATVAAWREAGNIKFEDTWETVTECFGLLFLSEYEIAELEASAEAGDQQAAASLGMVVSELELAILKQGFDDSMLGSEERTWDTYAYLLYGGYEPYVVKLTTILNQKAGISWTSYSHTGVPVQTSAIGVCAEMFNGYYDQTDIHTYMMIAAGFTPPDMISKQNE